MRRYLLPILALLPMAATTTVQAAPERATHPGLEAAGQTDAAWSSLRRRVRRSAAVPRTGGQYFIEFRSRYALSYGHTFLVYGRLNGRGEVGQLSAANVAGFHPAGAGPELWTMGHLVPVLSETGPSDGDLEEQYVSNRYRVYLSEAEFNRAAAYIRSKQKVQVPWHAALYNCNAWVGDVARYIGQQAPANHLMYPADYIGEMKRMNTGA